MSDDFFAPPPFRPADARASLARSLRELKLAERAGAFEWRGRPVLRIDTGATELSAQLAKRPAVSPEWERQTLRNHGDVRRLVETVRKRLADWGDDD